MENKMKRNETKIKFDVAKRCQLNQSTIFGTGSWKETDFSVKLSH